MNINHWTVQNSYGNDEYTNTDTNAILRYINSYDDRSKKDFYIRCYHNSTPEFTKEKVEKVQFIFNEQIQEIKKESKEEQLLSADFKKCDKSIYNFYASCGIPDPELDVRDYEYGGKYTQMNVTSCSRRYIGIFIDALDVVFNLENIYEKLFTSYQIAPIYSNLSILKTLVDADRFDEALKKANESAKKLRYASIQFELGEYCEQKGREDLAYQAYDTIHINNPSYEKAHERIYFILQNQKSSTSSTNTSPEELSEEEKHKRQLVEIDSLLKMPEDEQRLIDQRIWELCGNKDLNPQLTNIRYDSDTILAFCNHIKGLNEQIAKLSVDLVHKSARYAKLN